MEKRLIHIFKIVTACSSVLVILLILTILIRESRPEWKKYQSAYNQLAQDNVKNEQLSAPKYTNKIQQLFLTDLNRVDRCITCHAGVQDRRMVSAPIPQRTHSGAILENHPIENFGCTICHGGQGQAVDQKNAHARHADVQWAHPLLALEHIQASCGQCHLTIFSNSDTLAGTEVFQKGHKIFSREGCLGCHKARGVGGSVGPDLTEQGEKTKHEYSFANVSGEHTISNWLHQHFKDPEMVSPGSEMLAIQLDDAELHALVTFTMGMNKPTIPFDYFSVETLKEFKGKREELEGKEIFPMLCSACHGRLGEGKSYEHFETGVASIGNQDFLSVASQDFLTFTLMNGRGRRQMAAWLPRFSGLWEEEISATASFLKSRRAVNSTWNRVNSLTGNAAAGKNSYKQNCQTCHGENGKAAQVISINNPNFLAVATDEFLYQTITNGRGNTAMPAWGGFNSQEVADILAHLRTWQKRAARRGTFDASAGDAKSGEQLYHYRCSRCHGIHGQGESGPMLINTDFMATASDYFLSAMMTKGRHNTAMFGWAQDVASKDKLSKSQVADIISFLRASTGQAKEIIYAGSNFGQATVGEELYKKHCVECHGEKGEGVKAPVLNNQELLNAGTNGYLYATVTLGRTNTVMPAWGRGDAKHAALSIQQRHDVVAFLRKWQTVVIKAK